MLTRERAHKLSGIVLGLFLVLHLATNASALGGEGTFDRVVGAIERSSLLPLFELVILVPLVFHGVSGIFFIRGNAREATEKRYGDGRMLILQKIAALVLLVFLLVHLWELRIQRLFFGLAPAALFTSMSAHLSWTWGTVPWLALLYLIGLGVGCFHFSNGLTAAWRTEDRRRARLLTSILGALLFLVGAATVIGLATGTRFGSSATEPVPCGVPLSPSP